LRAFPVTSELGLAGTGISNVGGRYRRWHAHGREYTMKVRKFAVVSTGLLTAMSALVIGMGATAAQASTTTVSTNSSVDALARVGVLGSGGFSAGLAPRSRRDYQRGYQDGYQAGWNQARDDCDGGPRHSFGRSFSRHDDDYGRGYNDGFNKGYDSGKDRFCWRRGGGFGHGRDPVRGNGPGNDRPQPHNNGKH
jgi:hypothetical protein